MSERRISKAFPSHIWLTSEYGGGIVCDGCHLREYPTLSVYGSAADVVIRPFLRAHRGHSSSTTPERADG